MAAGAAAQVLAGEPAERVVDRTLRAHRTLTAPQRQALVEALFNVGLWRRRLAHHLGSRDASAAEYLFALLHALAGLPRAEAEGLAGTGQGRALRLEPPTRLGELASLPEWLATHLEAELGEEAPAFCAHTNVPGPITLRANTLRTTREALAARLRTEGVDTRPGRYSPLALHVVSPPRPNLYALPALREGLFEVQDEGSQLIGLLVEAHADDTVLDLCAGAGGKTLLLGAALAGRGRLHAYDPDRERLGRLAQRALRAGLSQVRLLWEPPEEGFLADRVLVDAPCSELGVLRRGPDVRFRLAPDILERHVPTQRGLLARAARHLRPGGRLVYATCTLNRAENADRVADFLAAHPDFTLRPPGAGWLDPSLVQRGALVCLPHRHGTDGFYAVVLERCP